MGQSASTYQNYGIVDGSLIKASDSPDVYIVKIVGKQKFIRLVLSPTVFESYGHLDWNDIIEVPESTLFEFQISNLVRATVAGDSRVYLLLPVPDSDEGAKRWVISEDVFNELDFNWDSIYTINETDRDSYDEGEMVDEFTDYIPQTLYSYNKDFFNLIDTARTCSESVGRSRADFTVVGIRQTTDTTYTITSAGGGNCKFEVGTVPVSILPPDGATQEMLDAIEVTRSTLYDTNGSCTINPTKLSSILERWSMGNITRSISCSLGVDGNDCTLGETDDFYGVDCTGAYFTGEF